MDIECLLSEMSLDEKIGQLCQVDMGSFFKTAGSYTGPAAEFSLTHEQVLACGSYICGGNTEPEQCAAVYETVKRETPHGIPPLIMSDVIHGCRTIFPIPLALGCTFVPELAETMARVSAEEAAAYGIHVSFAPMCDVIRDPRWGRSMESPGESPKLVGDMAAAIVRGFHGDGLDSPTGMAACCKHFAAYGLVQAGQEYMPVDVSRTELYNTYLPPFKAALDAGCDMLMPAFTPIDRVPAVANRWLMKRLLREKWGWDGFTISDWAATGELIVHGAATEPADAARLAMDAELDMDMMGGCYHTGLKQLVESGAVPMQDVDRAVRRVLKLKEELGLFDTPVRFPDSAEKRQSIADPAHRGAALQAAIRSCVLLKNEGVLPLNTGVRIALTGDHADTGALLGNWHADGRVEETESLRAVFSRDERLTLTQPEDADVILWAVGENQYETGEAGSKASPTLTAAQLSELETLRAYGKPIVTVLFTGRALIIPELSEKSSALLNAWFPGTMGAEAIHRLLMGDENPSGHLSVTLPRSLGQVPIHHDRLTTGRPNRFDGNGAVSRYIDETSEPLYPFGFGLSYTSFEFDAEAAYIEDYGEGVVAIHVTVRNTGRYGGETVVQVYARPAVSAQLQPEKRLVAYQRVGVGAGAAITFDLPVEKADLVSFDSEGEPLPVSGLWRFAVGESSAAAYTTEAWVR